MEKKYALGILGLGVMGRSLALNFERNGYPVTLTWRRICRKASMSKSPTRWKSWSAPWKRRGRFC